jgi:nucleoside 2-deoxyribosyltransferase
MKCFVASAIGKEDVDLIYDNAIYPVLKELKIKPFRVDRVEHNEDIDDQIFKLIDSADLCIADLTYARPSVYYEAGYAFGTGMPVVYIARSDHFRAQDKDQLGNLRVHFDLQMKNIIPWTAPNKTFCKKLGSRIRLVTKPILQAQKIAKKTILYEKNFSALPLKAQLSSLVKKGKYIFFSKGFRFGGERVDYRRFTHLERRASSLIQNVFITATLSITKSLFDRLYFLRFLEKENRKMRTLILLTSIRSARKTTLISELSAYTPISNRLFSFKYSDKGNEHIITVGIIDGVKSVEGFAKKLKEMIQQTDFG